MKIPEGKINDYAIEHFTRPEGEVVRSNMRTAFLGGQAEKPLTFDYETRWHRLLYDGGIWMTDLPIEQQQHDNELAPMMFGSVLVAGLGVGYAANVLAARPDIYRVVVVEIAPEVVKLVGPHIIDPEGKVEIVEADIFDFLRSNTENFDHAFYDIWQSDNEETFNNIIVPLRRMSWEYIDDNCIVCWNENVMRGQLALSLQSRAFMLTLPSPPRADCLTVARMSECLPIDSPGRVYWNWMVPFWQAFQDGKIPSITDDAEGFQKIAGDYAGTYGREAFGWWWERATGIEVYEEASA